MALLMNTYLSLFLFQRWLDQNLKEMEVLKGIGALIMEKKVKEIQIKSKNVFFPLRCFIRMKLIIRKTILFHGNIFKSMVFLRKH